MKVYLKVFDDLIIVQEPFELFRTFETRVNIPFIIISLSKTLLETVRIPSSRLVIA